MIVIYLVVEIFVEDCRLLRRSRWAINRPEEKMTAAPIQV